MLNFKPEKLKTRMLLMRWAVLGGLMLAVGAVAVWGGVRPEAVQDERQGIAGLLNERQSALEQTRLADQLQSHISDDVQAANGLNIRPTGEQNNQPDNTANNDLTENDTPADNIEQNSVNTAGGPDNEPNNSYNEEVEEDVVDQAPEPWVGDELLTVEANFQQMLPPLSGSSGLLRDYGYSRDTVFNDYRFHYGVDLAGSLGAAVLAPLAGTVVEIREDSFNGSSIVLEHEGKLQTAYYSLTPKPGLQTGQKVIAGEKLGELCAPPPFEEGLAPHLHWEISLNGKILNPVDYL